MKWLVALLVVFSLVRSPVICLAVDGGLSVSPPFVSVTVDKEKEIRRNLTIKNDSKQPLTFKIKVIDFGSMDESGGIAFLGADNKNIESKYGLASWLSLEKDALVVGPGKEEVVGVTVLNKESLSPGGHYGAVWLVLDEALDGKKIGLSMSYASLFYVAKIGGANYSMDLNKASFDRSWIRRVSEVDLRFRNSGNVHLVPRGLIEVYDWRNKKVAKGAINADSAIILPESFRVYNTKLNSLSGWWWPGQYRIEINYRYDGKADFVTKKYYANYVPWWVGFLPVLSVLIFVLTLAKKRSKKLDTQ